MEKKIPMRTCICCRNSYPKNQLMRIVKNGEDISLDFTGKKNGRGAYICKNAECVNKLKKTKALNRAFSMEISEETYTKIAEEFFGNEKQG